MLPWRYHNRHLKWTWELLDSNTGSWPLNLRKGIHDRFSAKNITILRWRHNGRGGVSNHQPHYCLFNRIFRRRSKKTSKIRVTGICAGNSARTGGFPAQMASKVENFPISWRHHDLLYHAIWPLITRSTFMYPVSWINSSPFSRRRPLAW